jgi:hypothetical protein
MEIESIEIGDESFRDLYRDEKEKWENITYSIFKKNWFVISGFVNDKIYYVKFISDGNLCKR